MERDELLLAITRCPEVGKARGDAGHPCHGVVCGQEPGEYQVPEPWVGQIDTAPILFIALNPGYDGREVFPTPAWDDADTKDFFIRRFAMKAKWTSQATGRGIRLLMQDANGRPYYKAVDKFYGWVRSRADELVQRQSVPTRDYVMTSVVHCKSGAGDGDADTVRHCSGRWLNAIMELSVARVVVTIGDPAWEVCAEAWGLEPESVVQYDMSIAGRERAVLRLPERSVGRRAIIRNMLEADDLERLRQIVGQRQRQRRGGEGG